MKLYLGCGPSPVHEQHLKVLGNPDEWTFVDLYVKEPHIKNWDAMRLHEVPDGYVTDIYASHLLEHFEHSLVSEVLKLWRIKLAMDGRLTINVPNLLWATRRLNQLENEHSVEGYYNTYTGEHGVMSIFYGSQSHEGEYHKTGFTPKHLANLLHQATFRSVKVYETEDAHDMGVLIAEAIK